MLIYSLFLVPVDVQQLVAIYDKPHESPDSGIISSDGEFIPCLFVYLILAC